MSAALCLQENEKDSINQANIQQIRPSQYFLDVRKR